ncbi:FtsX-like permease family protein [Nonomuraea sp. NPDC050394]|uniref:FtsX-like permease family protein n=1 Tax=Nonomuraea sp. NPDC050394 TaxID=3364363 RepID=UPI0037B6286F
MSAFRAALRISRRDGLRAKGRSALVMVMIALPVFVFTALLTGIDTSQVSSREGLGTRLGSADAQIITQRSRWPLVQNVSGERVNPTDRSDLDIKPGEWKIEELAAVAPGGRLITYDNGSVDVRVGATHMNVSALEIDLRDPMTRGMRELAGGRFPSAPGEVAVSATLAGRGMRLGDTLHVSRQYRPVKVVGVVAHPFEPFRTELVGLRGTILFDKRDGQGTGFLLDADAPVRWPAVERLNQAGLIVHSRAVIIDPPRDTPSERTFNGPDDRTVINVVSLGAGVVMIVLETVLLAGPAFAVSLRRRRRELAVYAAQGASPGHLRTIVLADGLLLGGIATVAGLVLGLAGGVAGASIMPFVSTVGPVDIPWLYVAGIALLGLASGVIAALAPAVQAARQSPSEVLAGREDVLSRERAGKPVLGLVLVLAGLVATYFALRSYFTMILAAAVLVQLGLVALMPWLVRRSAGLAARLPLSLRLSVRDATRHRVRTASAAAAVMGVTTTLVAVGIAFTSLDAQSRDRYDARMPAGTVSVSAITADDRSWAEFRASVERRYSGTTFVTGYAVHNKKGRVGRLGLSTPVKVCKECSEAFILQDVPVGDADLLALVLGRSDAMAEAALAEGKAIVFHPEAVKDGRVKLEFLGGSGVEALHAWVPAITMRPPDHLLNGALIPPAALTKAGYRVSPRILYAAHTPADPTAFKKELESLAWGADAWVETGYRNDFEALFWAMAVAALVLALGGTFAATGLAAADMRRDMDTMSAVGAPSVTRRLVVAAQAAYITLLGTVMGLGAGTVTGIAWAWSEISNSSLGSEPKPISLSQIAIPWALLAVTVIVLPLVAAVIAGAFTRTRLTLSRRIA